ncbi:cysteine desulfurase family protein, partial [Persephonella sp. KM09-Lau-8]|uniref:cysteine desulfurase family protein n=1 Tax=Persephonella sp. KM09-Lau-8 TaxID=1158345 RepID=UPI0004954839
MVYLDNAATTPVFEDILNNLGKWQREYFANPNSLHPDGQKSRIALEEARRYFAGLIDCLEEEIVFTSCATESNNTVIKGLAESYPEKDHIIISPVEHKSVLMPVKYLTKKGYKVDFLKIDNQGKIDLDHLRRIITPKTLFVGVIHVNNETGVIQDITEIGKICREKEVPFFSDTVQSFGKVDIPFEYLDFFSISGHKINAPKGIGLLKINKNIDITPLLHGGGQENGFRSGTENVVGAIALKEATQNWIENEKIYGKSLKGWKNY